MVIIKKFVSLITLIYLVCGNVRGLTCYRCTQYGFGDSPTSNNRCYLPKKTSLPYEVTCAQDSAKEKYYCRTQFRWEYGILSRVERGCVSSLMDEDKTTSKVPDSVKCDISSNWYRTDCYYHCLTSNCNTQSAGNYKSCKSTCGGNHQKGRCDVLSGECNCASEWKGEDCLLPVKTPTKTETRRCVQCTSETDELCHVKKESSACSTNEALCSFTKTLIFSQGRKHILRQVAKGCSSVAKTSGGCRMNLDHSNRGRWTYTCHKTCKEDGCNADLDFSFDDKIPDTSLRCIQCSSGSSGSCYGSAQPCPPISTHCQYTSSHVYDSNPDSPSYLLLETSRGCTTAAVPTQCIDEDLGFNLTKTTCKKTCDENGCNSGGSFRRCKSTCGKELHRGQCDVTRGECICALGWMGQDCSDISANNESRRCVQCTSERDQLCEAKNETSACLSNEAFCYFTQIHTFSQGNKLISRLVTKGCSSAAVTYTGCKMNGDNSNWKYTCHRTCPDDGCNADLDFSFDDKIPDRSLRCVQCSSGTRGNCYGSAQPCPPISTHCQYTLSYVYESNILNPESPSYLLLETNRGCATPAVPRHCVDEDLGFNLTKTTCQRTCQENGCNSGGGFRRCKSTCGKNLHKGQCDVTSGECICASGWTGQDCSEISTNNESRRCVQCKSERDELCKVKNETSTCLLDQAFCFFTEIHTFNQGNKLTSRLVTKGCSSAAVTFNGCNMNRDNSNWKYTCHRTCPDDGCNANLDFSSAGVPNRNLQCGQCSDAGNCYAHVKPCSPISTHCQSTTSYVFDKNVLNPGWSSHLILETYRGCATAAIPTQCIDEDIGFNLTKTTCQKTCEGNGCNRGRSDFKRCKSTCGKDLHKGQCDLTSGECICAPGWTGQDCSEIFTNNILRRCVQCTSERDELCKAKNETSACLSSEAFCYFSDIHSFSQGNKLFSRLVTKGCSSAAGGSDGCKMNLDYSHDGRWTYTCHNTCAKDGCNADLDFSSVEKISDGTLLCAQCSRRGSCFQTPEPCPIISTHCQSTISYVYNNVLNTEWSSQLVLKTYRGCATAAIPTQCIDEDIGFNLTKTTCQETCEGNGCNQDWPTRPKCVQCSAIYKDYFVGSCLNMFPTARRCPYSYQTHCTTKHTIGKSGDTSIIERGCGTHNSEIGCHTDAANNATREICTEACTTDACNTGYVGPKEDLTRAVLAVSYYSP